MQASEVAKPPFLCLGIINLNKSKFFHRLQVFIYN